MRTHLNIIGMDWDEVILILLSPYQTISFRLSWIEKQNITKKKKCLVYHTRLKIIKISLKPVHFEVIYISI